jgi:hypothetical protein
VSSLFVKYFFVHTEEFKFEERKCCDEEILEKGGRALEREEERQWRE